MPCTGRRRRNTRSIFSQLCREYLRMDATMLKHCGQKTVEGAIHSAAKNHVNKLNKLCADYVEKWPD